MNTFPTHSKSFQPSYPFDIPFRPSPSPDSFSRPNSRTILITACCVFSIAAENRFISHTEVQENLNAAHEQTGMSVQQGGNYN